jgi:hypothetical protein
MTEMGQLTTSELLTLSVRYRAFGATSGPTAYGAASAVRGEPIEWQVSGGDGSTPNGDNEVES